MSVTLDKNKEITCNEHELAPHHVVHDVFPHEKHGEP